MRLALIRSALLRAMVLVALAVLLLPGCSPVGSCQVANDCVSGSNCINKRCVAPPPAATCAAGQATCRTTADCATAMSCNPTGCCVGGCQSSADCGDAGACVSGVCQTVDAGTGGTGCSSDSECSARSHATPICLAVTSSCVQCQSTADCGGDPKKACEANNCVLKAGRCNQISDCSGTLNPACDTTTGFCVNCVSNSDCLGGQICSAVQSCMTPPPPICTQESDCQGDAGTPGRTHCRTVDGVCVACVNSAQCGPGNSCQSSACVQLPPCQSDATCTTAGLGHCNTGTQLCVQCVDSTQCQPGQSCGNNTCTVCLGDPDCATNSAGPHCNTTTGGCAQCTLDTQCPTGDTCRNGTCRIAGGCSSDADCANHSSGSYCLQSTGACVACLLTNQCTWGLFCQGNACGAFHCQGDSDCAGNTLGAACDTATGQCGQCTALNATACVGGLVCLGDACVPVPCATDTDCATNRSGTHCDAVSLSCVQCGRDGDCTAGANCLAGRCVTAPTCKHDADCTAGSANSCLPYETASYTAWTERCTAGSSTGFLGGGAACGQSADCNSGNCFFLNGETTDGICLDGCTVATVATDCDSAARCPANGVVVPVLAPGGQSISTSLPPVQICWPQSCLSDADCYMAGVGSTGRSCSPLPDPQHPATAEVLACLPPIGPVSGGEPCSLDSDCASGLCLTWTNARNGHVGQRCFGACQVVGTIADCSGGSTNLCRAAPVIHAGQSIPLNSCALPVP